MPEKIQPQKVQLSKYGSWIHRILQRESDQTTTTIGSDKKDSSEKRGGKKEKRDEDISKYADIVLTGGHGGAIPAFIVWLTKKIFPRSKDS